MEKRRLTIDELEKLLSDRRFPELKEKLNDMNAVDLAELLSECPSDKLLLLFRMLSKDLAADTFAEMDSDAHEMLIRGFTDQELRGLLDEMQADDLTDMLEEMPASVVRRVLSKAAPEDRKEINALLKYPDDSAGAVMTTEYVRLRENMTVCCHLRRSARGVQLYKNPHSVPV